MVKRMEQMDIVFANIIAGIKWRLRFHIRFLRSTGTIDDTRKLAYYSFEQTSSSLLVFHLSNRIFARSLNEPTIFIISRLKFIRFVLEICIYVYMYIYIYWKKQPVKMSSVGKLIILLNIVFFNAEHRVTRRYIQ